MRVILHEQASKEVEVLPKADRERVYALLRALAENPRPKGVKKLNPGPTWRVRVGDYRIIYEIDDVTQVVRVQRVAHRREVYR